MRRLATHDDPRATAMRAVASRDSSRWVAVALNGPLVRGPYTSSTSRLKEISFTEDESDRGAHVFAGPSLVVGAICAKSYAKIGWPTQITGQRDGALGNLPVYELKEDAGTYALPLEVLVSQDAHAEITRCGFVMLTCAVNSDAAVVTKAPVVYRGPTVGARAEAAAESTLADQLFVGRLAAAIDQLAAAIPADTDPKAASEVARVALADLFTNAPPSGPEIDVRVDSNRRQLEVTVRPRRYAGVSMEEVTLGAVLAG
jgi:predicted component of type VI protein secretion system